MNTNNLKKISVEQIAPLVKNFYFNVTEKQARRFVKEINNGILPALKILNDHPTPDVKDHGINLKFPNALPCLRNDNKIIKWDKFWQKNGKQTNNEGFFVLKLKKLKNNE